MGSHGSGILDHFCGVQQRLGRNASDVEADSAKGRPAFDQNDIKTKIRRAKRGRVAARSGTENRNLAAQVRVAPLRHSVLLILRLRRRCGPGRRLGCRGGPILLLVADAYLQNYIPRRQFITDPDLHFFHHSDKRGRHVHRGLVGLEGEQRLIDGNLIALPDQHFYDIYITEVTEVGNHNWPGVAHGIASSKPSTSANASASARVNRTAAAPSITR